MKLTKDEALVKIEELKKYVEDEDVFVTLFNTFGNVLYHSNATSQRGAVIEATSYDLSLQNGDLSGVDLHNADLHNADFSFANLRGANLNNANLRGANLRGANFRDADLIGANFEGAELESAKFCGKNGAGQKLNRDQVDTFLLALGFVVVEV